MPRQYRDTALEQLKTFLSDELEDMFKLYTLDGQNIASLSEDKYPCLLILEGNDVVHAFISSTYQIELTVGFVMLYSDSESAGRNMEDALIHAVLKANYTQLPNLQGTTTITQIMMESRLTEFPLTEALRNVAKRVRVATMILTNDFPEAT